MGMCSFERAIVCLIFITDLPGYLRKHLHLQIRDKGAVVVSEDFHHHPPKLKFFKMSYMYVMSHEQIKSL